MKNWTQQYKDIFRNKRFLLSVVFSFSLLILSIVGNYFAGTYAADRASNPVTDIVLDNIPLVDVSWFFVQGTILFWSFIAILCLIKPQRIPFTLKSIALFVFIRSIFISLTHIGPFPTQIEIDPLSIMNKFTFGADLFFSGHTGLPFLLAFLYWRSKPLRIFFILSSVFFGIVVLLAHLHYSIDVLSAFFITYTIFHIARTIFAKDKELFDHGIKQ